MAQTKQSIQDEIVGLVSGEKTQWDTEEVFVTDRVSFHIRELIKQLRKNFWGIFNKQQDPITGYNKTWYPLTEIIVEDSIKNADLDTKDMQIFAKNPAVIGFTHIIRNYTKLCLDQMDFGIKLDDMLRRTAIDGTSVWKTVERTNATTKKSEVVIMPVDLLNLWLDPTINSIQDDDAVIIERALMTESEVKKQKGWIHTEEIFYSDSVNRNDSDTLNATNKTGVKLAEIYERWGMIPKYFITANKKDTEMVQGRIVVSGTNGKWKFHYVEENKKGYKPYQEFFWTKIMGRWYGRGVAEKVMWLQSWINTTINIRIARARVSQLGIFKVKRGSGLSNQSFSRLAANGVIPVNNMEDIEQFAMDEASEASYRDEANIIDIARRVTSAYEIVTGETLNSSTTATTSSIMSSAAQTTFVLIREGIGMQLSKWIKQHVFPIISKNLSKEKILRIAEDEDILREIDAVIINGLLYKDIANGHIQTPQELAVKRQQIMERLNAMGGVRYAELLDTIDFADYDVNVEFTNESTDKAVLRNQLIEALKVVPEYKDIIMPQIFDLANLYFKKPQPQPQPAQTQVAESQVQSMPQLVRGANTLNR